MDTSNNSEFIYEYTSKVYEEAKRSNDIVTDKLTKVLAFSGVLLKFGYDMESEGLQFAAKFLVLALLIGSVGLCATGLYLKTIDKAGLTPEYLLEEQYGLDPEKMLVMISRAKIESIAELRKIQDYRGSLLGYAIGCLVTSGIIFGLTGILSGIH